MRIRLISDGGKGELEERRFGKNTPLSFGVLTNGKEVLLVMKTNNKQGSLS
ncbi:MAG: hypothetical protein KAX39_01660 [candidate division Zixibacteria bacterium]|nr:hypothetical protein [candidate division Zixibacteria bacterium]